MQAISNNVYRRNGHSDGVLTPAPAIAEVLMKSSPTWQDLLFVVQFTQAHGIGRKDLAQRLSCSYQALQRASHGFNQPSVKKLIVRLREVFGLEVGHGST